MQSIQELEKENIELKRQIDELNSILKDLDKKIIGKLWIWWFLPLFGFIVYLNIVNKRKQTGVYSSAVIKTKTEIAKNEYKILLNNKKINEFNS